MKIEQETKPETSKVPSEGSGGAVDLRAKLLARRKAQSAQINDRKGGSSSKDNEDLCVSKVLASGLNIGKDGGDDDDEEDDNDYMDIEDEDDGFEVNNQVGHGTTGEDWTGQSQHPIGETYEFYLG